jgi:hypothetical protein
MITSILMHGRPDCPRSRTDNTLNPQIPDDAPNFISPHYE